MTHSSLSLHTGNAYLLKICFTDNGEIKTPLLQNMMAVETYKNKAKVYVSQICAICLQISGCPFIKKEITDLVFLMTEQ